MKNWQFIDANNNYNYNDATTIRNVLAKKT